MAFHQSLCDSKSPQVSRTLLSILAILNNEVVWMVFIHPPTSKSSSPCSNPFVTVPNIPITIGIIVTFMYHRFFQFPSKFTVLILLFTFFQFYSVISQDSKVNNFASSLFLLIIIRSGLLAEIWWSVCMSKYHRSLCVLFSLWITLPTQLCLVLHSFCANLLHSLIMWLIISSLSPHSLHLLLLLLLLLSFYSFESFFFYISISWWFFTGAWVTASHLNSPGLFSIFWLISVML